MHHPTPSASNVLSLGLLLALASCAAGEPRAVLNVASKNLKCPHSELEAQLGRQTSQVREYYVACDFMYTRVHCSQERGCYTAPLEPPCFDGQCFKEDPVTLQWELDRDANRVVTTAPPRLAAPPHTTEHD
jgi:hypothetical protein